MKIGLLKYNVKPPNKEITSAQIKGTYGIFFSTKYMIATAINVEIINTYHILVYNNSII